MEMSNTIKTEYNLRFVNSVNSRPRVCSGFRTEFFRSAWAELRAAKRGAGALRRRSASPVGRSAPVVSAPGIAEQASGCGAEGARRDKWRESLRAGRRRAGEIARATAVSNTPESRGRVGVVARSVSTIHTMQEKRNTTSSVSGALTKSDIVQEISRVLDIPVNEGNTALDVILASMVRALRGGDKVEIRGFGTFNTRGRKARVGRNPKTGMPVSVPPKRVPFFKPSKEVKQLMNAPRERPPDTASTPTEHGEESSRNPGV